MDFMDDLLTKYVENFTETYKKPYNQEKCLNNSKIIIPTFEFKTGIINSDPRSVFKHHERTWLHFNLHYSQVYMDI